MSQVTSSEFRVVGDKSGAPPISPRLLPLSSIDSGVLVVKSGALYQSKAPSVEFKVIGEAPHQSQVASSEFGVVGGLTFTVIAVSTLHFGSFSDPGNV